MREHIAAGEPFVRDEVPVEEALERFRAEDQDYKVELIEDLVRDQGVETVSLYTNGPFTDLCRGPHAPTTKTIKAFKLESVAGAYWRGDSSRQMLTRIYGTAFFSREELEEHRRRLEEARARDHRKLGRELGLFFMSDVSPGSPFWLPNGMTLFQELTGLVREENAKRGYREVRTPILFDVEVWKESGHWDKYRDNMYFVDVEGRAMGLKPMNCPGHIHIYAADRRSYRDLPIRLAEAGRVHRHEPSGVLHGLLRVRAFTQDDAHIFCTEDQIEQEVLGCLDQGFAIYDLFGFEPRLELSTRPEQRIGSDEMWDRAEAALRLGARRPRPRVRGQRGRRRVLRPEDRPAHDRLDRALVAARDRAARLRHARALRHPLPGRRRPPAPPGDDPPRAARLLRALHRDPDRALRGRVPGVARAGAGGRAADRRPPRRVRREQVAARLRADGARVEVDARGESVGRRIREAELRKMPVHARRRRPRGAGRRGRAARAPAAATRERSRSRTSPRAWPASAPSASRGRRVRRSREPARGHREPVQSASRGCLLRGYTRSG